MRSVFTLSRTLRAALLAALKAAADDPARLNDGLQELRNAISNSLN